MHPPHPWRELRAMTATLLHWRSDLPDYLRGATNGAHIWMRSDMSQVERRCVLAHELEHIRRGHNSCRSDHDERAVSHGAARFLLPSPHVVADALAWSAGHVAEAADVLWVTERTLSARLDAKHLHPAEVAIIAERVSALGLAP